MATPLDLYVRLRGRGPTVWADTGRRWSVVASLSEVSDVSPGTWRAHARRALAGRSPGPVPFAGGLVGWFGYEAGAWTTRMPEPRSPAPLPDAWLGEARAAACFDHVAGEWTVAGAPDEVAALEALLVACPTAPEATPSRGRRVPTDDRARYEAGVRRILEHLRAGDCYQVNLARRVDVTDPGDPLDAWLRLRARNPARRAMLIETAAGAVVSNSPELLLAVADGRALSVPIKGTAPRSEPPDRLLRSPKERAELTMIVDLVRADLGRVAAPGSVWTGPRRVGGVGHVWHAMRRVGCTLAPGTDAVDAFAAIFPAGSVTGAPRIRAIEVVRDLEEGPRGVYCGAMGWFGGGGTASWNVAIRTITFAQGGASFHVGAGIVIGSDPAREWEETELKAQRMLEALGCT